MNSNIRSNTNSTIQKATELKRLLLEFESVLKSSTYDDDDDDFLKVKEILEVPLCKIVKTIVPEVQRKIDEISLANELGFFVCKSERGADIEDGEGSFFEVKTSVCQAGKNYKSNFIWPIPKGKGKGGENNNDDNTRKKLLEQVIMKTSGPKGGAYFIANTTRNQELNRYFLSREFLLLFFQHLVIPKSGKYNFGSERCRKCNEYHRLKRLTKWDESCLLIKDATCEIYNNVESQCKGPL